MKIYANRKRPKLEDFIGKDVWVRCLNKKEDWEIYMKPLYRYPCAYERRHDWITYNWYSALKVDEHDLGMLSRKEALHGLDAKETGTLSDFKLILPVDAYTTEDMIEIINDSSDSEPF